MAYKSLKTNTALYTLKSILSVIFPMITLPYVLRVLGVENIGKYNFTQSIISYFQLISTLGLAAYAKRDGAIIRDDRASFNIFASNIFSLNMIFTLISYLLFSIALISIPKLRANAFLMLICSTTIFLTNFGVEWIYSVYEDYVYITVRQIVIQILSLLLLFVFVKKNTDLFIYAGVMAVSSAGSNIWNFIHSKKYCDLKFILKFNWRKYLSRSLVFFASNLMITVYVNMDQTILGFICGDYAVGLYGASVKIYRVLDIILTGAALVGISRLSNFLGNNNIQNFCTAANEIHDIGITLTLPIVCGICIFSKEILYLLGGTEYLQASTSLIILSITLIGYVPAVFWGQCILIPAKKEKKLLYITIFSAILNFGLNLLLIPKFEQDAAAFTTLLSESFTAVMAMNVGRKIVSLKKPVYTYCKSLIGCVAIIGVSLSLKFAIPNKILALLLSAIVGGIIYFFIELLVKNDVVYMTVMKRKNKH